MSLKVFRMNEYDWVVAKEMDEAIDWYEELTGEKFSQEDIDDIEECDLEKDGQYTTFEDEQRIVEFEAEGIEEVIIPVEGNPCKHDFGSLLKWEGEWCIKVPFKDVLPTLEDYKEPYITATTQQ